MPQSQFPDTYLRLDASSYHHESFFKNEEEMANSHGLKYHATSLSKHNELNDLQEFNLPESAGLCLVTNTHTPVERIPQNILQRTKLMIHPNSGYDNFPTSWVKEQNFPIILGNKIRAQAVSQYILSGLLNYFNQIKHQPHWDRTRKWDRNLLDKQNILIIGYGEIGQILFKSLNPLCPQIDVYDPYKTDNQFLEILQPLHQYDIILFACGLNKSSEYLFQQKNIQELAPHVLIINAARGKLIEEKALFTFLKENPEAYAILDVFEKEPHQEPFKEIKNITTTSHIAGVSKDLDQRIISFCSEVLEHYAKDIQLNSLSPYFLHQRIKKFQDREILI